MGLRKTMAEVECMQQMRHLPHEHSPLIFAIGKVRPPCIAEDQNR